MQEGRGGLALMTASGGRVQSRTPSLALMVHTCQGEKNQQQQPILHSLRYHVLRCAQMRSDVRRCVQMCICAHELTYLCHPMCHLRTPRTPHTSSTSSTFERRFLTIFFPSCTAALTFHSPDPRSLSARASCSLPSSEDREACRCSVRVAAVGVMLAGAREKAVCVCERREAWQARRQEGGRRTRPWFLGLDTGRRRALWLVAKPGLNWP
jgi:hypothetical protein